MTDFETENSLRDVDRSLNLSSERKRAGKRKKLMSNIRKRYLRLNNWINASDSIKILKLLKDRLTI